MTPEMVAKAIAALIPPAMPTGMIFPWPGDTPPEGSIVADGRELSRTTYAGLFSIYGTKYGTGDGSTTFNVPDLDGRFIELTTDVGSVGQFVEPGLPNITGSSSRTTDQGLLASAAAVQGAFHLASEFSYSSGAQPSSGKTIRLGFDASLSSSVYGASQTIQPSAMRFLACIKV